MGKVLPRSVAFLITLVAVIPACSSGHRYMAVNEATGLPVAGAPLIASTAICVPQYEGTVEVVVGTSGEDGTATVAQHGNRRPVKLSPER